MTRESERGPSSDIERASRAPGELLDLVRAAEDGATLATSAPPAPEVLAADEDVEDVQEPPAPSVVQGPPPTEAPSGLPPIVAALVLFGLALGALAVLAR